MLRIILSKFGISLIETVLSTWKTVRCFHDDCRYMTGFANCGVELSCYHFSVFRKNDFLLAFSHSIVYNTKIKKNRITATG